ncbi:MAG: type II toxin-antitoxin system RelE/ParE family toxin [Azospirillaceae bacterium]
MHISGVSLLPMSWRVVVHDEFLGELASLMPEIRREVLAHAKLLETFGPTLGRPRVDTLAGSRFANMKELRFDAGGNVWRVAFAFDPERSAVLLVGGSKSGVSRKRFYGRLIETADRRYSDHLRAIGKE